MKTIDIEISGISPILQHRFAIDNGEAKGPTKKNKNQQTDDVEQSLYRLQDGKIFQPAIHLLSAMKKAGAKFQIPGQRKQTYKNLIGSGAVIISPSDIVHRYQEYAVHVCSVVVPATKGRIIRRRPMLPKWALSFQLEYDDLEIGEKDIREILDYAGKCVGIGDWRPEKGGSFGRFLVSKFKEQKS